MRRSHRERAAAEVVARRRGEVGDERGDVVVAGGVAGQDGRRCGSRSAPTRSTACAPCSPARRRARPRGRRRAGAGRGARACRRRRGSRPRWPPPASRSTRRPARRRGPPPRRRRPRTARRRRTRGCPRPERGGRGDDGVLVAEVGLERHGGRAQRGAGRRHVGGAARGGDDDALEQPGAQHGRGTIRGATLRCMAPAVHPKRASLPLPGGSEGAGVDRHADAHGRDADPAALLPAPVGPAGHRCAASGLLTPKSKWTWVPVPCFLVEHPTAGALPHRHRAAARGLPRRPRRARAARRDRLRHPHGGRLGGHRSARRARPRSAGHRAWWS